MPSLFGRFRSDADDIFATIAVDRVASDRNADRHPFDESKKAFGCSLGCHAVSATSEATQYGSCQTTVLAHHGDANGRSRWSDSWVKPTAFYRLDRRPRLE